MNRFEIRQIANGWILEDGYNDDVDDEFFATIEDAVAEVLKRAGPQRFVADENAA